MVGEVFTCIKFKQTSKMFGVLTATWQPAINDVIENYTTGDQWLIKKHLRKYKGYRMLIKLFKKGNHG